MWTWAVSSALKTGCAQLINKHIVVPRTHIFRSGRHRAKHQDVSFVHSTVVNQLWIDQRHFDLYFSLYIEKNGQREVLKLPQIKKSVRHQFSSLLATTDGHKSTTTRTTSTHRKQEQDAICCSWRGVISCATFLNPPLFYHTLQHLESNKEGLFKSKEFRCFSSQA